MFQRQEVPQAQGPWLVCRWFLRFHLLKHSEPLQFSIKKKEGRGEEEDGEERRKKEKREEEKRRKIGEERGGEERKGKEEKYENAFLVRWALAQVTAICQCYPGYKLTSHPQLPVPVLLHIRFPSATFLFLRSRISLSHSRIISNVSCILSTGHPLPQKHSKSPHHREEVTPQKLYFPNSHWHLFNTSLFP